MPGANSNCSEQIPQTIAEDEWEWRTRELILAALLCMLALGAVVGNLFVVLALLLVRKLKQPANLLIFNLALSDILVALFVMPPAAAKEVLGAWVFGEQFCVVYIMCDVTLCSASILNLCAIALDRYLSITSPFVYGAKRSVQRMYLLVGAVWALAFLISVPPLFLRNATQNERCEYSDDQAYQIYALLVSFFIPSALILAVYARIFIIIRRMRVADNVKRVRHSHTDLSTGGSLAEQSGIVSRGGLNEQLRSRSVGNISSVHSTKAPRQLTALLVSESRLLNKLHCATTTATACTSAVILSLKGCDNAACSRSSLLQYDCVNANSSVASSQVRKNDGKAIITLGIILGAFFICWTPFFVLQFVKTLCTVHCKVPSEVDSVVLWLGYTSSVVNPPIYSIFNRDFRLPFLEFLKCRCASINDKVRMEQCYEQFGIPVVRSGSRSRSPLRPSSTPIRTRTDRTPSSDILLDA